MKMTFLRRAVKSGYESHILSIYLFLSSSLYFFDMCWYNSEFLRFNDICYLDIYIIIICRVILIQEMLPPDVDDSLLKSVEESVRVAFSLSLFLCRRDTVYQHHHQSGRGCDPAIIEEVTYYCFWEKERERETERQRDSRERESRKKIIHWGLTSALQFPLIRVEDATETRQGEPGMLIRRRARGW
jgi:hypothetical protein